MTDKFKVSLYVDGCITVEIDAIDEDEAKEKACNLVGTDDFVEVMGITKL